MKISFKKYLNLFFLISLVIFLTLIGYLIWQEVTKQATFNTLVAFVVFYLINLISSFFILLHHRNFDSKIAWMFIIILFPIIGQITFIIFGRKYKTRVSEKTFLNEQQKFWKNDFQGKNQNLKNIAFFQKMENIFKIKPKNFDAELINNGAIFFEKLFDALSNAKKFIHIEIYIIRKDLIWEKIKKILIQKAQEGVEVRIIMDGFGAIKIAKQESNFLTNQGVKVCVYGKMLLPFINSSSFYRIHKKNIIIDGEKVFTGGTNFGKEYVSYHKNFGYWMDTNLIIEGELVRDYALDFILDWKKWQNEDLNQEKYAPINIKENLSNFGMLIKGGPNTEISFLENFFLQLIYQAKKEILIYTPYFVPTERIFLALKEMLLSGIKIKLIVPGKNDKMPVFYFNKYHCQQLEEYGAKIYVSNKIFIHSKAMIIDENIGYIGTMNCDVRSFYSQYEINALAEGKIIKNFLDYHNHLENQKIIQKIDFSQKSKLSKKILGLIVKIFKPLF